MKNVEEYTNLVDAVKTKLDEAEKMADTTEERLNHDDVFRNVRSAIRGK